MTKTQRRTPGTIVRIPLGHGLCSYALVLAEPLLAFFDVQTASDLTPEEVLAKPVLFRIWVMNRAITSGRWEKVASAQIPPSLKESPAFFKKDAVTGALSLYKDGTDVPASRDEVATLECAAVWDPERVEDRLRDHFAGVPNKWVGSLNP